MDEKSRNKLRDDRINEIWGNSTRNPVVLVALSGKSQSGKSTIAKGISSIMFGVAKTVIISIAGLLKQECMIEYHLSSEQVNGNQKDCKMGLSLVVDGFACDTPRQVLQRYGQAIRKANKNHWIDMAIKNITTAMKNYDIIIIDDLRFVNEAEVLKKNNAILIRISREFQANLDDVSETELDNYDGFDYHFINNSTDLNVLEAQLLHNAFVRELLDIYGGFNESTKT